MTKILTVRRHHPVELHIRTAVIQTFVAHSDNPWYKNKFQIFIAHNDNPFQSLKVVNIPTPNDPQKTYPQKEEKKMIYV